MSKLDRAPWRQSLIGTLLIVVLALALDVYGPWHSDLRKFDPDRVASLETSLWRDYYDRQPVGLYWDMVQLLRSQDGFPLGRAALSAYWAGKAAFIFKEGKSRPDYVRALPYLKSYYQCICRTGQLSADAADLAESELEWWIVHRERGQHGEPALVRAIAVLAGKIYEVNPDSLIAYALPRARAMLKRTEKEQMGGMTSSDWNEVEAQLRKAYSALATILMKP